MDRATGDNRRRIGAVKAAATTYRESMRREKPELKRSLIEFSEDSSSRSRELHLARRDIWRLNESRNAAESVKADAESELLGARNKVKDLTSLIEESRSKTNAQKREQRALRKPERREGRRKVANARVDENEYVELVRELEFVKKDLSKLKADMASVLEEKLRADKETEASSSKRLADSNSMMELKKKIEEMNEEHVLVELARIEAVKELGAIEAERQVEAVQFSNTMEKTKKRINNVMQEVDEAKELEMKLAVTNDEVNVLQNELSLVKAMEKRVQENNNSEHVESSKQTEEELSPLLRLLTEELEAAKKGLASIKEEGFQFMTSMDVIRDELKHVTEETTRLKNSETKAEITIKNLNSKLLRAKSKLEATSVSEEKAKAIASNLSLTLQQLEAEAEAGRNEKELISRETESISAEIQKTEYEIDLAVERLQAAMQELEAVKSSEAINLENLKALSENTMKARALASRFTSSITISNFEYEYLKGRAQDAQEIADKKVAAAQSWIEALKASEKEILMKTEIAYREIRELRAEEEEEIKRREMFLIANRAVENIEDANLQHEVAVPRKSMKDNSISAPTKRAKLRRSSSQGARNASRSNSIILKKRKKVMPNLVKLFRGKKYSER